MSDLGRKNLSDKISEKVTPDSQKSVLQQGTEAVSGAADKVAAAVTPESQKLASQTLADKAQSGHDEAKAEVQADGKTIQETAGEYFEAAKGTLGAAVEQVSAAITGATEGAKKGSDSAK